MSRDDLKLDLLGLAASNPRVIVDIILACVAKHPQLEATVISRHLRGNLATRSQAENPRKALPPASEATVKAVLSSCQALPAKKLVKHKTLIIDGLWVDISVKPGDPAVIVGANVVSLAGVASMVQALGGDAEAALVRIGDAIASALSGPVTRRAMTRLEGSTRSVRSTPSPRHPNQSEVSEDPAAEAVQVLAAMWSPAAAVRRMKDETTPAYLDRLVAKAQQAVDKDAAAKSALDVLRDDFPSLVPKA